MKIQRGYKEVCIASSYNQKRKFMNEEIQVQCPYCGEFLIIEPEPSDVLLEYIEDCHVCCQPIVLQIRYREDGSNVAVRREND